MKKIFGYPIYFLLLLVLLKVLYLLAESTYNTIILDSGVIKDFSEDVFYNLELLGHNITSIGVTLLLMPFLYWFINKVFHKSELFTFFTTIASSFIIYMFIFISLDYLMDYIVEKNKDKRYNAYYLNILKNGISNNILGHSSILKFEKNSNKEFSIDEKVILNNIFLLSYIDNNKVIEKISTVGMDSFLRFYKQKKYEEEFKQQNEEFIKYANSIKDLYNKYNEIQLVANKTFRKNEKLAHTKYLEFKKSSIESYDNYKNNVKIMNDSIAKDVKNLQNDREFRDKWNEFVKYYNKSYTRKRALQKYDSYMYQKLGRTVEPHKWCQAEGGLLAPFVEIADGILGNIYRIFTGGGHSDYSGCLNTYAVTQILSKTYHDKWYKKTKVPFENINTFNEYLLNQEVKREFIQKLKKQDINVSNNFNYTEKEFKKAFMEKVTKETYSEVNKMYKKIALSNIKHNLDFRSFVLSNQVSSITSKKLTSYSKSNQKKVLNLIANQKTEQFYKVIYLPNLKEYLKNEVALTKQQLFTKYKDKGNKAIKALYIPPIAISLSLIFGVLNAISLFALIIALSLILVFKYDEEKVNLLKKGIVTVFILISISIPFIFKGDNYFNNAKAVLENNTSNTIKIYSDVLTWIFIFEKYNYPLGLKIRSYLPKEQLNKFGI